MKDIIIKIPILGSLVKRILRHTTAKKPFSSSEDYWIRRYDLGGNSGIGSYNELAEFKAEIINSFVRDHRIETVIEYGCGDGNQLRLADYPSYIGFEVSPKAVAQCRKIFQDDTSKRFGLMSEYRSETAQLSLSLDVIYHLLEDEVYYSYMERLFASAQRYVIIYSSNFDSEQKDHQRHRKFSEWVAINTPQWKLVNHIPNKYPYESTSKKGSLADFYIYEKV